MPEEALTRIQELAAEIEGLPSKIHYPKRKSHTQTDLERKERVAAKRGKCSSVNFSPEANSVLAWARSTPGQPVSQSELLTAALTLYRDVHRDGAPIRKIDREASRKLDALMRRCEGLTELEVLSMCIRHTWRSFKDSPDGLIDT